MPVDYLQLIPELREWNNGKGITIDEWLGCRGDFQLAIAFSRLFWPCFTAHDGCILFAEFSQTTYAQFFSACNGDCTAVEAVMNHKHILDLFVHASGEATREQLIYLGRVLKDIYTVKLKHDFPARTFTVHFDEGPFEDFFEYQLTFWQQAHRPDA